MAFRYPAHALYLKVSEQFGVMDNQGKEFTVQLNPYLMFNGQCEEAFKFYEQCLGGKIVGMFTYAGSPMAGAIRSCMPAWWWAIKS
jgi:hypothetical protein